MSSFRQLMMKAKGGGSPIPSRYTVVDYIATSGNQYIDTGIQVGANVRTVTEVKGNSSLQNISVFGSRGSSNNAYYVTAFNSKWYFSTGTAEHNGGSYNYNNVLYEIDYNNNGTLIINGTTIDTTLTLFGNSNLLISCRMLSNFGRFKYYSFKVYVGANLSFDGIPVYDTVNSEYGMYDLISQAFFGNVSGSGTITGGND